jgi:biotin synthase-related radical SAM superfamily protein
MKDYLLIKAELLTEGVRADAKALEGVGTGFKEQNHGLFGWDFENHTKLAIPDDFFLEDGSVVQFRLNKLSPFVIRKQGDSLQLFKGEEPVCAASWIKRPDFYWKKTSSGIEMVKVGQIGGVDNLFFCYQNYCSHFAGNKQCAFCNLVSTSKTYHSVLKRKQVEDIGEVARAAWQEGVVKHVNITGGCFNNDREVTLITEVLHSIRSHTGFDRVPGVLLPSPAKGDDIKKYFDAGIQALGYSMEIWDDALYRAICPGKAETTTHAEFLREISSAISVFGPGNVHVMFVMGIETRETFLEGVRVLSELGALITPYVWAPNPGSKLSGHRAPFAEWYVDTVREAASIITAANVPVHEENNCYLCDGNTLLPDALRKVRG